MKKKNNKEKVLKCPHYKGEGYAYTICENPTVYVFLCDCCNMNLASEIMGQLAIEAFAPTIEKEDD